MKHTPGPWELDDSGIEPMILAERPNGDKIQVATVRIGLPETHVNAALLLASLDLLEACKQALELLEDLSRFRPALTKEKHAMGLLESAIAKAEASK